jgi:tripartite-type tricarboxylate transporter receptor subunit TctC
MLAILSLGASVGAAHADPVADFYKDRTINLYIGYGVGGTYDATARLLARHMPKHIPGAPTILASNMPGASSMLLANYLARVAPKDGTAFGAVNSALLFDPLFAGARTKAQFKGPDLTMIGNAVGSASVLVAWSTTGVRTIDDVRAKGLTLGATSPSGDTYLLPLAVKNILGLERLKIVIGYPGTREAMIALEQGEITGRVWSMEGLKGTRPDWLRDGKVNIVAQLAPQKMPEVPSDVPLIKDYVKDADDRAALDVIFLSTILARPYIAPEGVPKSRAGALRRAFDAALADPELLQEAKQRQLDIDPMSGEKMQEIIEGAYSLSGETIAKVRRALTPP